MIKIEVSKKDIALIEKALRFYMHNNKEDNLFNEMAILNGQFFNLAKNEDIEILD